MIPKPQFSYKRKAEGRSANRNTHMVLIFPMSSMSH